MENVRFEHLMELSEQKKHIQLKTELNEMNEVDVAEFLEMIPPERAIVAFRMLRKDISTDVFPELSPELQEYFVGAISDQELSYIIEDLYVDDAVDMLDELPANLVKRVLRNAKPETRSLINQFLNYPEDSAGTVMTAEYLALKKDLTVDQAIQYVRKNGVDKETVYLCYVTDKSRVLEGVLSFKDLLFASPDEKVEDIMDTEVISVNTWDDKEVAANVISKYDLLAIPVVDAERRLVGIVTVDDAMDVMEEAATEDIEKMAAMAPSEKPYMKTDVFTLAKNRFLWLLVLMISGMITGTILANYQNAIAAVPLLVSFIPMLTDTGGNAGSQSATIVIRGLALSDIKLSDWLTVVWKEIRVGVIVGLVLGVINLLRIVVTYPGQVAMGITLATSVCLTVILAKAMGCLLPILAKSLRMDPALMSAPLITTIVDAVALIAYFTLAKQLMGI